MRTLKIATKQNLNSIVVYFVPMFFISFNRDARCFFNGMSGTLYHIIDINSVFSIEKFENGKLILLSYICLKIVYKD